MRSIMVVLFACPAALWGCASSNDPSSPMTSGQALYEQPFSDGNSFACATCHALEEPAADGIRRPGHAIGGASARPSYKNGQLNDMRQAVNSCLSEWMNAPTLGADDPRWFALREYLSDAGDSVGPLTYTIVSPPAELGGGDASSGERLFNDSCSICHGQDATGSLQGPSLVGASVDAELIARRVRTSGNAQSETYDGLTGGVMPFWSAERLSDGELLDIIAYVEERAAQTPITMDASVRDSGVDDGSTDAAGPGDCPSTHPAVGRSGALSTEAHKVSGTATVINDCTIRVDNFNFDGGGIDVRWYAGTNRNYVGGFAISEDIYGTVFENETVYLTIPDGKSLDDFDSISVWCVAVGANFGDTQLQ